MNNDDFGFDFDFLDVAPVKHKESKEKKKSTRRQTICDVRTDTHLYRRAFSETSLMDVAGLDFKDGESYHFITAGDVDAISFLKLILRQQKLEYCLFSTWCMAAEDILQFEEWLKNGTIKKLDAYVGEIFPGSYIIEHAMLKTMFEKYNCGRIAIFKNHSKIFAGTGDKFSFGIETSANINTNPRTENGCITIGPGLYKFYRKYFDGIISFEKTKPEGR